MNKLYLLSLTLLFVSTCPAMENIPAAANGCADVLCVPRFNHPGEVSFLGAAHAAKNYANAAEALTSIPPASPSVSPLATHISKLKVTVQELAENAKNLATSQHNPPSNPNAIPQEALDGLAKLREEQVPALKSAAQNIPTEKLNLGDIPKSLSFSFEKKHALYAGLVLAGTGWTAWQAREAYKTLSQEKWNNASYAWRPYLLATLTGKNMWNSATQIPEYIAAKLGLRK